jgi:predicted metal-dependent enzyme (double-stranded beta helix superfamily)
MWGLVGMLRGSERSQAYVRDASTGALTLGECSTLKPGDVAILRPALGDIHKVTNAFDDCGSLSIHVYGGNIGAARRHIFDPATGAPSLFISGYTNQIVPNFWDRSAEVRAAS